MMRDEAEGAIEVEIAARPRRLDSFEVGRVLPAQARRMVGPFTFFDHMGPARLDPGDGMDVRPHPHIGLATVTFLWDGAIRHRDSLGSDQVIRPGDVNWMTAGRGIVHSERTPAPERAHGAGVHGMQTWVALPRTHEEAEPSFHHHAADTLPWQQRGGALLRVIAGRAYGEEAPVRVFADTLAVALDLEPDAELALDAGHAERALYILEGQAQLDGADVPARHLILPDPGQPKLRALTPLKAVLLGGEPLDGRRHLWWNFVSSSRERIEQAKQDWLEGRFGRIEGDEEFIPLPPY